MKFTSQQQVMAYYELLSPLGKILFTFQYGSFEDKILLLFFLSIAVVAILSAFLIVYNMIERNSRSAPRCNCRECRVKRGELPYYFADEYYPRPRLVFRPAVSDQNYNADWYRQDTDRLEAEIAHRLKQAELNELNWFIDDFQREPK